MTFFGLLWCACIFSASHPQPYGKRDALETITALEEAILFVSPGSVPETIPRRAAYPTTLINPPPVRINMPSQPTSYRVEGE